MDTVHRTPWMSFYDHLPGYLPFERGSIYDMFYKTRQMFPDCPAYDFMGRRITYTQLNQKILHTAQAFLAAGVERGEHVLLSLPNLPQTVDCFYALNYIGAVSALIHPLSTPKEIERYLSIVRCKRVVTLDMFAQKFLHLAGADGKPLQIIVAHVSDELDRTKRFFYHTAVERRYRLPHTPQLLDWSVFLSRASGSPVKNFGRANDPAVILFTGGSTGKPKGALLSNLNLNAQALQTILAGHASKPGSTMLAILPMFHGFGLGVGVHTALGNGGTCILVPQFSPKSFANILRRRRPNYIVGVPTIYDSLVRLPGIENLDLSCLMGAFSGGDTMTDDLRRRVNTFFTSHGASVKVLEGYGMTECVAASCLNPSGAERNGSVGIPYPGMDYAIVHPDTAQELPFGQEGEICLSGPTVMLGFVDQPEATAQSLHRRADGSIWLHTGDLGYMDSDGFVYFVQRLKRMIITNGYNVYPGQVESVLETHPAVKCCCVIGVPDSYRGEVVKAYIILENPAADTHAIRQELDQHCHQNIIAYACPQEYAFVQELPVTLVGKVDFLKLMEQEADSQANNSTKGKEAR